MFENAKGKLMDALNLMGVLRSEDTSVDGLRARVQSLRAAVATADEAEKTAEAALVESSRAALRGAKDDRAGYLDRQSLAYADALAVRAELADAEAALALAERHELESALAREQETLAALKAKESAIREAIAEAYADIISLTNEYSGGDAPRPLDPATCHNADSIATRLAAWAGLRPVDMVDSNLATYNRFAARVRACARVDSVAHRIAQAEQAVSRITKSLSSRRA